jgi:hypothetical protein
LCKKSSPPEIHYRLAELLRSRFRIAVLDIQSLVIGGESLVQKAPLLRRFASDGGGNQFVGPQLRPQQAAKFLGGVGVQQVRMPGFVLTGERGELEFPGFEFHRELSRLDPIGLGSDVLDPFDLAQMRQDAVDVRRIAADEIQIKKLVRPRPVGLLSLSNLVVFIGSLSEKIAGIIVFREQHTLFVCPLVGFVWVEKKARSPLQLVN